MPRPPSHPLQLHGGPRKIPDPPAPQLQDGSHPLNPSQGWGKLRDKNRHKKAHPASLIPRVPPQDPKDCTIPAVNQPGPWGSLLPIHRGKPSPKVRGPGGVGQDLPGPQSKEVGVRQRWGTLGPTERPGLGRYCQKRQAVPRTPSSPGCAQALEVMVSPVCPLFRWGN
jgi:hypothetical protein